MLHFFYGLANTWGSCNDNKKAAGIFPAASQILYALLFIHNYYLSLTSPSIPRRYLSSFLN